MSEKKGTGKVSLRLSVASTFFLLTSIFLVTKVIRTFSGSVGTTGGIWNIIQVLFVIVGMICALKYLPVYKNNTGIFVLVLYSCYVFMLSMLRADFSVAGLFSLLTQPYAGMVLVLFYIIGARRDISRRTILHPTFYILAAIIIFRMVRYVTSGSLRYTETVDVADVYYLLGLMPLVFMTTEKKKQIIPVIISAIALVLCGKRTGILAVVAMTVVLFTLRQEDRKDIKNALKKVVIILALGIALYYLAMYLDNMLNLRLFIRLGRMSEDGGSGRIDRWALVLSEQKNASVFQFLFGHGWNSLYSTFRGHAHNDYIEILYDFGIVAVLLYIMFYINLCLKAKQMMKCGYPHVNIFIACLICSLFLSMFSFYAFMPTYITCGLLSFGLLLADFEKYKKFMEIRHHAD